MHHVVALYLSPPLAAFSLFPVSNGPFLSGFYFQLRCFQLACVLYSSARLSSLFTRWVEMAFYTGRGVLIVFNLESELPVGGISEK